MFLSKSQVRIPLSANNFCVGSDHGVLATREDMKFKKNRVESVVN